MLSHCGGKQAHDQKAARGLTTYTCPPGVDFHPTGGGDIPSIPLFTATEGWDGLSFGYLLSKFSKVVRFAPYKRT